MNPAASEAKKATACATSSGEPHATRGNRREVGVLHVLQDVRMPLDRDEPGRKLVHGDAVRSELSGPASRQPYLGALRSYIGGAAGRRSVDDLRVDLDDASPAPFAHPRNNSSAEQDGALDEDVELRQVIVPPHVLERRLGIGPVALKTRTETGPSAPSTARTSPAIAPSSVTSAAKACANPPASPISAATSSVRPSSCRPLTATARPSPASRMAMCDGRARGAPGDQRDTPIRHLAGSERA